MIHITAVPFYLHKKHAISTASTPISLPQLFCPTACEDRSTQCASWQAKGFCHPTYQFTGSSVKDYWCPKSCKACSVTDKEPAASGPTPGLRPVTILIAGTMYPICITSKVFTTTGDVAWGYEINDYCAIKGMGCSCVVLHDAAKPGPAPAPKPAPVPAPSLVPAPELEPEPEPAVQNPVGEQACWHGAGCMQCTAPVPALAGGCDSATASPGAAHSDQPAHSRQVITTVSRPNTRLQLSCRPA